MSSPQDPQVPPNLVVGAFPAKQMSAREIDHAWEALVEVTHVNPTQARGELNYALGQIREATKHMDIEGAELGILIRHRATLYRRLMPDVLMTPPSLAKWWDRLEAESERVEELAVERVEEQKKRTRRVTNAHAKNDCTTCGGDWWVVVRHRAPHPTLWRGKPVAPSTHPAERGHEEVAPCPVCNTSPPLMQNFWDGRSWSYGREPGEVVIG